MGWWFDFKGFHGYLKFFGTDILRKPNEGIIMVWRKAIQNQTLNNVFGIIFPKEFITLGDLRRHSGIARLVEEQVAQS